MSEEHESTPPPSPAPIRKPAPSLVGLTAADLHDRIDRRKEENELLAVRVATLEALVGALPTPTLPNGAGALGVLFTRLTSIDDALRGIRSDLDAAKRRDEDREKAREVAERAAKERREPAVRVGTAVLIAVLSCIAVGCVGGLGAVLARGWSSGAAQPERTAPQPDHGR